MRRFLVRLALWVLARWGPPPPEKDSLKPVVLQDVVVDDIVRIATKFCMNVDTETQTGEWKRHKVYAQLLDRYPKAPRHHIGLAIELAMLRLKTKAK